MNKNDGILTDSIKGKGRSVINRNIIVFTFFLFLSFIFWYLSSLGKDLEADIRYPVQYINLPQKYLVGHDLPDKLNLVFSGPGYSILQHKIAGKKSPIVIDFRNSTGKILRKGSSSYRYILTSGLLQEFNSQLKSGCKVTAIKPDSLFFKID